MYRHDYANMYEFVAEIVDRYGMKTADDVTDNPTVFDDFDGDEISTAVAILAGRSQ